MKHDPLAELADDLETLIPELEAQVEHLRRAAAAFRNHEILSAWTEMFNLTNSLQSTSDQLHALAARNRDRPKAPN